MPFNEFPTVNDQKHIYIGEHNAWYNVTTYTQHESALGILQASPTYLEISWPKVEVLKHRISKCAKSTGPCMSQTYPLYKLTCDSNGMRETRVFTGNL